jgi:M6 family metalloprotease-like protein
MVLRLSNPIYVLIILISTFSFTVPLGVGSVFASSPAANLPLQAVNGPQTILVILAKFSDRNNNTSPSQISRVFVTVNSYYNEDSYGTLSFQPTLTPGSAAQWYTLPQTMSYYGADTVASDNQLVTDSLQAAYNSGIDLSRYKFAVIVHSGNDEAITHVAADIHSFTIPGFVFSPAPLVSYKISSSVVAESDPVGVYCHEFGHLLGLPDLYDLTKQIDPANNFMGYWEIMALGEWNPNTGNPLQPSPGTYPSHHSVWSKIQLGFVPTSKIVTVKAGDRVNVTLQNLEQPTQGNQSIKVPISVNSDGSLTYYLLEMRAKLGIYDQYLPFPSTYPGAAVLIYKVNESITPGHGSVRLIDAHPGGDLNDAGFGPCNAPCSSNNAFSDSQNFVNIIITKTTATAYTVTVDRTSSPLLLLQVNTPSPGTLVSVDGTNSTADSLKEVRLTVHYGPHSIYIQQIVPVSLGSTTIGIGLTNSFASWNDGSTANPRWVSISHNTILTANYRMIIEPSFATAATATAILALVVTVLTLNRRRHRRHEKDRPLVQTANPVSTTTTSSLPGNYGLPGQSVNRDQEAHESHS